MNLKKYNVERLTSEYVKEVTSLWRESMIEALGIKPVHSFKSQAYFLEHILPNHFQVVVVISSDEAQPVAFMASSEDEINQLYVSPSHQGVGIGTHLLNLAKEQSCGSLTLRTFEINQQAQHFYQSHGFTFTAGNSDNEEGLLDLECKWAS